MLVIHTPIHTHFTHVESINLRKKFFLSSPFFSYKYELMIINQRPDEYTGHKSPNEQSSNTDDHNAHHLEPLDGPTPGDIVVTIDPSRRGDHRCDPRSFTKPIERNPSCGKKNLISFARVSRSTGFVRLGNLLVKTRVYLKNLLV